MKDKNRNENTFMGAVYASPEVMQKGISLDERADVYPYIHAKRFLFCGHCGQELEDDAHFCSKCGKAVKNEEDLDATMQFCALCGKSIPWTSVFCPYCGNQAGTESFQGETLMACVYASPENMGRRKFKGNFLKKIFKRKK